MGSLRSLCGGGAARVVVTTEERLCAASDGCNGRFNTLAHIAGPTSDTVGDIRGVAVGCAARAEVAGGVDGARVVGARGLVVLGRSGAGLSLKALLETIARGGSSGAVGDHLLDGGGGAGSCQAAVRIAGALACVALHETGVQNAVVGGLHANAALAFLHNNCKDESSVDASLAGE